MKTNITILEPILELIKVLALYFDTTTTFPPHNHYYITYP